jgi:hypothetical protein
MSEDTAQISERCGNQPEDASHWHDRIMTAICQYLHEGRIIHLVVSPRAGKVDVLRAILLRCANQNRRIYYCDSNAQFSARVFDQLATHMFHIKLVDLAHLQRVVDLMGRSDQFTDQTVIIDSLSHIIQGGENTTFQEFQRTQQHILSGILNPLRTAATRNRVHFVILHHYAFHPKLNRNIPVAYELMQTLTGLWIHLRFDSGEDSYRLGLEFWQNDQFRQRWYEYRISPEFCIGRPVRHTAGDMENDA